MRASYPCQALASSGCSTSAQGPTSIVSVSHRAHTCSRRSASWVAPSLAPTRRSSSSTSGNLSVRRVVCHATIDDPELLDLVKTMESQRPAPPAKRDKLEKIIAMIDEANSKDPSKVTWDGQQHPYRLLYSQWVSEWVNRLDPKAPDELLILARGRNMESWRLAEIKRDDYAPNSAGVRQWEGDRRRAQAKRVTDTMTAAGYDADSMKLVEEVMLDKEIPDPREIRKHDLVGPLGLINYKRLEEACMIQTLRDADALVFMEKNFPQMFARMSADEVLAVVKRELARISNKCIATLLSMEWSAVQKKLVIKALPSPKRFGTILGELEGTAAASTHPGDWRYRDFDYE